MKNKIKHALIINTNFDFSLIEKSFTRTLENTQTSSLIILFAINRNRKKEDLKTESLCRNLVELMTESYGLKRPVLIFRYLNLSKSSLINESLRTIKKEFRYIPEFVTICNDDVNFTKNSLKYLERGSSTDFLLTKELIKYNSPSFDLEDYSEKYSVGFTGPCANYLVGDQFIEYNEAMEEYDLDTFSDKWHKNNLGNYLLTKEISFDCITITKDCIEATWLEDQDGILDETLDSYFYDKDFLLRAYNANFLGTITSDCFIGSHSLSNTINIDKVIDKNSSSIDNKLNFLLKYKEQTSNNKVCASYTFSPNSLNDLNQFKTSFTRSAKVFDNVVVLITKNPADCMHSYDGVLFPQMRISDKVFLQECAKASDNLELIVTLTKVWLQDILKECQNQFNAFKEKNPNYRDDIDFNTDLTIDINISKNYRDNQNKLIELSKSSGANWCFSLNHNEVIEDRITNKLVKRWTSHPNPLIFSGNISKIYHWENSSIIRKDTPFLDIVENRLFKLTDEIVINGLEDNGLHCSHSPSYGDKSTLVSSIRVRDLSLVRIQDRQFYFNKFNIENTEDDTSQSKFGSYSHILAENVITSLFFPSNGVALTMLTYKRDEVSSLERWLNYSYMFFDKINFVWTEEWNDEDKVWLDLSIEDLPNKENWYTTGPSWEHAILVKLYSVDFCHRKLDKNNGVGLAACRNKGIEHLIENNDGSIRWALFFDPDETYGNYNLLFEQIRNLAELRNIHAYVFQFDNILNTLHNDDKENSIKTSHSESIRMFYLEPNKNLLMNGLVHEGFETALDKYKLNTGTNPKVVSTKIKLTNHGLSNDSTQMGDKLKSYANLLVDDLLEDNENGKSWMSLGLQFLNDFNEEDGLFCLKNACKIESNSFITYKELSLQYLRMAQKCLFYSYRLCPPVKQNWKISCENMLSFINDQKIDLPIIDTNGYTIEGDKELYEKFIKLKESLDNG